MRRSRFFVVGALLSGFAWMLAGGYGGMSGGEQGSGGAADVEVGGQGGVAGAAGQAGEAGASGAGGAGSDVPVEPASFSCQVAREGSKPVRQCVTAGIGELNAPC